jgi:hypothetical protein
MEQVRARTTSPKRALRFLLMGVALLIVNMWIRLHWLYLRFPGQGPEERLTAPLLAILTVFAQHYKYSAGSPRLNSSPSIRSHT